VSVPEFHMSCEQDPKNSHFIVTLRGEIDAASVPALREFILALDGDVEVDCKDVTFIDSSGIGLFAAIHRHFEDNGRHVALRKLTGTCYRLFEITGLAGYLDVTQAES
jgi:anti-sigma B factor antagonist